MKKEIILILLLMRYYDAMSQISFEDMQDIKSSFFDLSNLVFYIERDTCKMIRVDFLYTKNSTVQGFYMDTYFINNTVDNIKIYDEIFSTNMITQSDGGVYDIAIYCDKYPAHLIENIDSYDSYGNTVSEAYRQEKNNIYFKIYEIIAIVDKFKLSRELQKKLYPHYSGLSESTYRVNNILSQKEYKGTLNGWEVERFCNEILISPLITK